MAKIFVVLESHTFQNNKCKKFIQKIVPYGTIKIAFVLIFFFKQKKKTASFFNEAALKIFAELRTILQCQYSAKCS